MLRVLHIDRAPQLLQDKVYAGDSEPCFFCGRPIRNYHNAKEIEVIHGGAHILVEQGSYDPDLDSGYLGVHLAGPDCYKKFKLAVDEYAEDVNPWYPYS